LKSAHPPRSRSSEHTTHNNTHHQPQPRRPMLARCVDLAPSAKSTTPLPIGMLASFFSWLASIAAFFFSDTGCVCVLGCCAPIDRSIDRLPSVVRISKSERACCCCWWWWSARSERIQAASGTTNGLLPRGGYGALPIFLRGPFFAIAMPFQQIKDPSSQLPSTRHHDLEH
jgi:hypothetical protein